MRSRAVTSEKNPKKKTRARKSAPKDTRRRRDARANERAPEPEVHAQAWPEIPAGFERYYWPQNMDMPGVYVRRAPLPCPECKRVLTDHASQAVVCDGVRGLAYLRCRCCDHRWQLPVKTV